VAEIGNMLTRALAILISSLTVPFHAQNPAQTDLEEALRQADKSRQEYVAAFTDLIGIETRVTELLNKSGATEKQQTVMSDFLVYRSRFKSEDVSECHITREIDGKAVRNPQDEAMKLFRELAKARTQAEESAAIWEQNAKHTLRFLIWGLTLQPLPWVREEARRDFDVSLAGHERLGEDDAVVLAYQSKELRPSGERWKPLLTRFKNPRFGWRGQAWLDSKDWRIRRWVDDLIVTDDEMTMPVAVLHKEIEYERGRSGGTLPARIVASRFEKSGDKASRTLRPVTRITFTYDGFKRFDVTTAAEIKKPEVE